MNRINYFDVVKNFVLKLSLGVGDYLCPPDLSNSCGFNFITGN